MKKITLLKISDAIAHIETITDASDLHALRIEEEKNPTVSGGRRRVLETIEQVRQELLNKWRESQSKEHKVPVAVVGHLTDDSGAPIQEGTIVAGLSEGKLKFYAQIGGIEWRDRSST